MSRALATPTIIASLRLRCSLGKLSQPPCAALLAAASSLAHNANPLRSVLRQLSTGGKLQRREQPSLSRPGCVRLSPNPYLGYISHV